MVLKKILQRIGVGGPSVDTVLDDPRRRPGESLSGEVRLVGGEAAAEIEHIALSLVAQGRGKTMELHRTVVSGATRLAAKEERTIRFTVPVPWAAPLTEVSGQPLPGLTLGVRTELAIAKAVDKGDLDAVAVTPLPSQDAVLDAFGRQGFLFAGTGLAPSQAYGAHPDVPVVQALAFAPPPQYSGLLEQVALILIPSADGITVAMEADQQPGAGDPAGRVFATHDEAANTDWAERIAEWLNQIAAARQAQFGHPGYQHPGAYGQPQRRGAGIGGMVAGAAAGVAGGMLLGEMLDGDDEDPGEDFGEF